MLQSGMVTGATADVWMRMRGTIAGAGKRAGGRGRTRHRGHRTNRLMSADHRSVGGTTGTSISEKNATCGSEKSMGIEAGDFT